MKVIYLAAANATLDIDDKIIYQDKIISRDLNGCMLETDLSDYDFIIATPPCNFWSRARGNKLSQYSLDTKHLLIDILEKLDNQDKPFIIENVINRKRMHEENILPKYNHLYHEVGRHSYFTNIKIDLSHITQKHDFRYGGYLLVPRHEQQGGNNVKQVLEYIYNYWRMKRYENI